MKGINKYNLNTTSNHKKLRHRRSIRLNGYDYSQAELYFSNICCQSRICRFEKNQNGRMILNGLGIITQNEWIKLSERLLNFELDVLQIIPNHLHSIIALISRDYDNAPAVGVHLAYTSDNNANKRFQIR